MPPELDYSERNLLDAVRRGKTITEAELEIVLDRLVRARARGDRYRTAFERYAPHVLRDLEASTT